jgi:rhodanese-related sulfurtransferase
MRKLAFTAAMIAAAALPALAQTAQRIALEEFRKLHASKAVLVVDVRDPLAFAGGHIPGAVNIQLGTEARPESLAILKAAGKRPIVTYCA